MTFLRMHLELDVSEQFAQDYIAADDATRAVMLAQYSWGFADGKEGHGLKMSRLSTETTKEANT